LNKNEEFKIPSTTFLLCLIFTVEDNSQTPTLRQLYLTIRQIQIDLQDVKSQLVQERTHRGNLQQLIMNHIEKCGSGSTT
jgi:Rho guanine nucleotide exchange factor 7